MENSKPLNDDEIKFLEARKLKFNNETRKRYSALIIVFALFFTLYKIVEDKWLPIPFIVFFVLVFIAFTFVVRYLSNGFKKDILSKSKMCTEGILERKFFKGHRKNMTSYKIDENNKWLYIYHEHLGTTGVIILKYDQDNFDGKIRQNDNLFFVVDGKEYKVDVKHFVVFDEGEKILIEQFFPSKDLIRISSLDNPEKTVQTSTLKFI